MPKWPHELQGVSIPLATLPWPSGRRPPHWPGIIAAEVNIFGEYGLSQERTIALPHVRQLAKLQGYRGAAFESFQRPNGEGGIYGVQAVEDAVTVPFIHSMAVLEGLFDQ